VIAEARIIEIELHDFRSRPYLTGYTLTPADRSSVEFADSFGEFWPRNTLHSMRFDGG